MHCGNNVDGVKLLSIQQTILFQWKCSWMTITKTLHQMSLEGHLQAGVLVTSVAACGVFICLNVAAVETFCNCSCNHFLICYNCSCEKKKKKCMALSVPFVSMFGNAVTSRYTYHSALRIWNWNLKCFTTLVICCNSQSNYDNTSCSISITVILLVAIRITSCSATCRHPNSS